MIIRQPLADLALASLVLSVLSALVIALDIGTGRRQAMKVMEITWPVTALYMGPLALVFYFWFGRAPRLGDPQPRKLMRQKVFTSYLSDFSAAYVLGIWFQYLPIRADRGLSRREAFIAAVKADTLSLLAFELGLFLWMALAQKVWFGPGLTVADPVFWF